MVAGNGEAGKGKPLKKFVSSLLPEKILKTDLERRAPCHRALEVCISRDYPTPIKGG